MKRFLFLMVLVALVSLPAHATELQFGFSGGQCQALTVFTASGNTTFSTGDSRFDSECNQGWWSGTFFNSALNDSYAAGDFFGSVLNNFFTFDLSSLHETVLSATLNLRRFVPLSDTPLLSHTYVLYDVQTNAATLNNNSGTSSSIFDDLGSGTSYGNFSLQTFGNSSDILSLSLNSAGVSAINSASGGFFSVGGCVAEAGCTTPAPEPSSFLLASAGLLGLGVLRRKAVR